MKFLDTFFMRLALKEAAKGEGSTEPNPMVGCVLVRPDLNESASDRKVRLADPRGAKISGRIPRIVGIGYHHRFGAPHAEVEALRQAGKKARGATAYVTLEPCCHYGKTPPCVEALIQAGVKRVVAAMPDPFPKVSGNGVKVLRQTGIEVSVGTCRKEAEALNAPYITRLTKNRPWVIGKWAMTLDGKIATKTGSSCWVSSEASRLRVHRIRSHMDCGSPFLTSTRRSVNMIVILKQNPDQEQLPVVNGRCEDVIGGSQESTSKRRKPQIIQNCKKDINLTY